MQWVKIKLTQNKHRSRREPGVKDKQAGTQDKQNLPWCGGAFFQGGGSVGAIGESILGGHDQWEGDTGFTGALAVGVGHWHGVDTSTWKEDMHVKGLKITFNYWVLFISEPLRKFPEQLNAAVV